MGDFIVLTLASIQTLYPQRAWKPEELALASAIVTQLGRDFRLGGEASFLLSNHAFDKWQRYLKLIQIYGSGLPR